MSYEFIKLSEVEKVESSYNANLIIEEDGEIKRLSTANINFGGGNTQQVQADWNETNDSSPAFILNKPLLRNEVINFTWNCGNALYVDGVYQDIQTILEAWNNGVTMRINGGQVLNVRYYTDCGAYLTMSFMDYGSIMTWDIY